MRQFGPFVLATALCAATGGAAVAQSTPGADALKALQRLGGQYLILMARSFVDLTYESLTIEAGTHDLVLSGVTIYPELPWDDTFQCEITVDRAVIGGVSGFETLSNTIEIGGVAVPPACFEPGFGEMLPAFGYVDGIVAETVTIDLTYDLPSAAADVTVQAAVADAADVSVAASFNYLWIRIPVDGGDPKPVAVLGNAEVALSNRGLFERLEPLLTEQMGDLSQAPQMVQGMLNQMLGAGGPPSPEVQAFTDDLAAELGRFVADKDRLVVSVAPDGGLFLDDSLGRTDPADLIALLQPQVSAAPMALDRMIAPDALRAALAGGAGIDEDQRLEIGEALLTGVGAPLSIGDGSVLLAPLAEAWHPRAALLMADALAQTEQAGQAYALALRAMAGGESRAIGIADRLEAALPPSEILARQRAADDAWPDRDAFGSEVQALVGEGDVAGLRHTAYRMAVGRGAPRSYAGAYFLTTLAAAAGDRGAANLRRRLDRRFDQDADWRETADRAAAEALRVWTEGLAETLAERAR